MSKSMIHYHMHSDYSLLDSCTNYEDYVKLAVENGEKALSISEHGKPLNWTEKWKSCKDAGIRYIHSVEIYLTESLESKVRDNYHTVLLAKNMDGVRELNQLISKSCNEDHFYYVNRITFDEFLNISENIISTSACLASPLNKLPKDHPRYMDLAKKYTFLEIQPHDHPEQVEFNHRLFELSKEIGTPLIAGTDTHSSSKYKAECRAVLLEAKHKSYGDEDKFDLSYKTRKELIEKFQTQNANAAAELRIPKSEYVKAVDNTNLLYDMTEDLELDVSIKYPILYGTREKDNEVFEETVERKFKEKVETGVIPKEQEQAFREAIDEEMRVFRKLNMTGFMLSMSELVCWCKGNNMPVGPARGSVGGSRVAYVTDIIDLNPEQWHTVFSRFCNENREEVGDVDIDCVESDRTKIFEHIVDRFGHRNTAKVAAFGTIKARGVIDDVGRYLATKWEKEFSNNPNNPWSLKNIAIIKDEFDSDEGRTRAKYPQLFYYFDGLLDTKISQSVHPAGIVISPITLDDNFGVFDKDGYSCLMLDMDNIHDFTGLVKYDFLPLKTIRMISDVCEYTKTSYPKSHEIDWNDKEVWDDLCKNQDLIFQFESSFAADCLKKYAPQNIFDMSLVTACIRPSGSSYRDDLLAHKAHKNPSTLIDDLLKDNNGYLIYQENIIAFLQQICGLSGSEADTVRRGIGRKKKEILDAAMPSILKGYCDKSPQPKEVAEAEVKEFLQIIEDASSYMFGYNHSIAYCMLGYLCAYYRHYYPIEFITAFLNNAANDDDIRNGTAFANKMNISITSPKWGSSLSHYFYDKEKGVISKGLSSIKHISKDTGKALYDMSTSKKYIYFTDVVIDALNAGIINTKQLDILIKIDFFSEFGNQRELLTITDIVVEQFKKGTSKQIKKSVVAGMSPEIQEIIKKYSTDKTKSGNEAASYKLLDLRKILVEIEDKIKSLGMTDIPVKTKIQNFYDAAGYVGYVSGLEEDRRKLYVTNVFPINSKKNGSCIGERILTKSIGSGKESAITVWYSLYRGSKPVGYELCDGTQTKYLISEKIDKGDLIELISFSTSHSKTGTGFVLEGFRKIY